MSSFGYLHQEFNLNFNDVVRVDIDTQANVMLLDSSNYNSYRSGSSFRCHGRHYDRSPVLLKPPHSGYWHLVIDLGGRSGSIRHAINVIRQ